MKKETKLMISDFSIIFIALVLLLVTGRPDFVVLGAYFLLAAYFFATKRTNYYYALGVASVFALVWVSAAGQFYDYKNPLLSVLGFKLFPLFAWATGLFCSFLVYEHLARFLKLKKFIAKILVFTLFYISALIISETIGYHYFGIQLVTDYPGLPLCNCIHAPLWFQISYLLMGPVYFAACYLLEKYCKKK